MAVLDVTIINVALHPPAPEFDALLATVQWVATGYTLFAPRSRRVPRP
jgi:hypothetical protein